MSFVEDWHQAERCFELFVRPVLHILDSGKIMNKEKQLFFEYR
jgi:hypothetical protein